MHLVKNFFRQRLRVHSMTTNGSTTTSQRRILYCVAILRWTGYQWLGGFEYLHAECAGDARIKYTAGNSNDILRGILKVTGIAPVVGYMQDNKTGQLYA